MTFFLGCQHLRLTLPPNARYARFLFFEVPLALIDPQSLQECFLKWVQQLTEQLEINLINIDY
jgi:hypothetical protein